MQTKYKTGRYELTLSMTDKRHIEAAAELYAHAQTIGHIGGFERFYKDSRADVIVIQRGTLFEESTAETLRPHL
jgi:hypothetical protein